MTQSALLAGAALSVIAVWPAFRRLPLTPLVLLCSLILIPLAVRSETPSNVVLVLFSFAYLAVARLAVPLFVDIARQLLSMETKQRKKTIGVWLLQAAPVLMVIALLSITVRYLYAELLNTTIYDIEIESTPDAPSLISGCEPPDEKKGRFLICQATGSLENDIDNSILMVSGDLKQGLSERLSTNLANAETDTQSAIENTDAVIWEGPNPVIPNTLKDISPTLEPNKPDKGCGLGRFIIEGGNHRRLCVKYWILGASSSLYEVQRKNMRESFSSRKSQMTEEMKEGSQSAQFIVHRELNEAIGTATKDALYANGQFFFYINLASSFGLAIWLTVFIKFASLRAARLVFNEEYGGRRMRRDTEEFTATGRSPSSIKSLPLAEVSSAKELGKMHGFQHEDNRYSWHLFTPFNLTPLSKGDPSMPQPLAVSFRRMVTRRYFAEHFLPGRRFGLVGDASCTFIRINVPHGKRLAIDLRHLIAFSDGIQLSTFVDVSVAGLVQERMMLSIVSGVGEVILFSPYGAFGQLAPEDRSAPPECLVAFDVESELVVEASDKWVAGLLGQLNVNTTQDERGTLGYVLFSARLRKGSWARFWRQLRLLVTPI